MERTQRGPCKECANLSLAFLTRSDAALVRKLRPASHLEQEVCHAMYVPRAVAEWNIASGWHGACIGAWG